MPQQSIDPALPLFQGGILLLSIMACINVFAMRRGGPVLPYEPRRPVPWGPVGCVLAVMFVLITVYAALAGGGGDNGDGSSKPLALSILIAAMLEQLFIVGTVVVVIAAFTKATPRDLGLPASSRQGLRDVCVGAAACLAALAPVHVLQQLLLHLCFPDQLESGHPLIKMVMDAPPDPIVLFVAGVHAVIVAPICEEVAFRLLLQGWLERWEDERLGWRRKTTSEMPKEIVTLEGEEALATSYNPTQPNIVSPAASDTSVASEPPRRGIAGMRYGWFPIVVSSTAFGLAHFGYGPEPVPLFLLALALGYLYQRTHRIIPSIVAHALFNLFTMIILWRMVYHHG